MSIAGLASCGPGSASSITLTVFAAASTGDVVGELARRYESRTGIRVRTSFASSSTLARQIEYGAHADLYLSAAGDWMDHLERAGCLKPGGRRELLGNELVLVAPVGRTFEVAMRRDFAFARAFTGRASLGDPDHVPAGIYAKQALRHLGWWDDLESRLVPASDVRHALRYVELGEVDCGVVYRTDVATSKDVEVIATFPADSHDPIRYPVALIQGAPPEATGLLDFLSSEEARDVYERAGFVFLPR